jgi:nucleotide-binding universal stress UspA family protein
LYGTILIALEHSDADKTILEHARRLARLCGSRLVLMHVADGFVARTQNSLNLQDGEEIRQDREYLDRCRGDLAAEGFTVDAVLGMGDPAAELVGKAEALGVDLIAMATHGHGFLNDLIRGSVANAVRHRTSIPVLMVRATR